MDTAKLGQTAEVWQESSNKWVDIYVSMKSSSVFGMKSYNIIHLYKHPPGSCNHTTSEPLSVH